MKLKFFLTLSIILCFGYSFGQVKLVKPLKTSDNIEDKKTAKSNFRSYAEGNFPKESSNPKEISDLYWYLKKICQNQEQNKKYGKDLLNFAKSFSKIDQVDLELKLEMLDFLWQNQWSPGYVISEYVRFNYMLDKQYNYFAQNKIMMSDDEIERLARGCEYSLAQSYIGDGNSTGGVKINQIVKLSSVRLEIVKRNPTEENYLKLLKDLELIPNDLFHYFFELNNAQLNAISVMFLTKHELVIKYADLLINKNKYLEAIEYLNLVEATPQIKMRIFRCIKLLNGVIAATDYLMDQKPQARSWNSVMSEATADISPQERYDLIKHLYKNHKKALDSLDFTLIFGFTYINECLLVICEDKNQEPKYVLFGHKLWDKNETDPKVLEEKYKFITRILKEFEYFEEAEYFKEDYWSRRIITESNELGCGSYCYEVVYKYFKQGVLTKSYASSLIYQSAKIYKESLSGIGQRGSEEFERPYKIIIDLCNKSLQIDPNNALNYKLLGDVYSALGNTNKSQQYYNLATRKSVNMKDRPAISVGNSSIKTGPRGGKYYINSNGNRTYVK